MRTFFSFTFSALICQFLFLYSTHAHAVNATGYINAVYDRAIGPLPEGYAVDSKVDMEGRLRLKTKFKNYLQGVIAMDAAVYEREIVPSRLYVDYKPDKRWRLRIGYAKKIIGLAYEQNKEERLIINRSAVYEKMNNSGLVGRQLAITLRLRPDKSKRNTFTLGASHDGSRNTNITWSAIHKFQKLKGLRVGLWGIMEMRNFKKVGKLNVVANALALWYQRRSARFAIELIHGIDPDATHYEMLFRNSRKVHFLGPRLEAAYRYHLAKKVTLQPVFHSSMLFDDLHHPGNNSLQFLLGLNLKMNEIVLSINGETIGDRAPKNIGTRRFERKNIYVELVYFF